MAIRHGKSPPFVPVRGRRFRRRLAWSARTSFAIAAALGALLLGGCPDRPADDGTPPPTAQEPQRGGQAVVALATDIKGVNTLIMPSNRPTEAILRHVLPQLMKENADFESGPPSFRPDLAESWEWSDEPLAITFHLRKNAVWTDGTPITAADVRFTWQAQVDPQVAWDTSYYKETIRDVEVVDDHTVRFHLTRRQPAQLLELNEGYILPKHVFEQVPFAEWRASGQWFADHLVSAGPFNLTEWKPQQEIVLERNDSYYGPAPYLDRVVFRVIPDRTNRLTQLLAGEVDFVTQIATESADRVESDPELEIVEFWGPSFVYLGWNVARERFADRAVRRALTLGIDRQTLVDNVWGKRGRVTHSPVLQNVWAYNPEIEPHPYDPERARQLLADAGWRDSDGDGFVDKGGETLAIELLTNGDNRQRGDAAVLIQSQLERIGVKVEPRLLEFQTMVAQVFDKDFDAYIGAWTMPTGLDFRYAFHTEEIEAGSNMGSFSNPEVDQLMDEIRQLPDLASAKEKILRLQLLLHEELPYTFLWESQRLVGVNRRLHDTDPNVLFVHDNLPRWWVSSPE